MTILLELYGQTEEEGIDVDWFPMVRATSLSTPLPGGGYGIAMDPWKIETVAEETVLLAHELGHCETGSFYNRWAARDVRQKHENHANKWAIQRVIPEEALDEAVAGGCDELWSLAEHFGVTEDFMRLALCWYAHRNLDVADYIRV